MIISILNCKYNNYLDKKTVLLKSCEFSLVVAMAERGATTKEVISPKPEVTAAGGLAEQLKEV